jgi:leucyl aminopeptidase
MPISLSLRTADLHSLDTPLLVLALAPDPKADGALGRLDKALGGSLSRTFERRDFRGARDETLHLAGIPKGPQRILLVGTGTPTDRNGALKRAAAIAARKAHQMGAGALAWHSTHDDALAVENVAIGLIAGAWEYTDLKTPPPTAERRQPLGEATILVGKEKEARPGLAAGEAIGAGQSLARRLAMMPGNLCTPDFLEATAREIATRRGQRITVLDRAGLEKEEMGSFLSVAQGTPEDPRLVTLEHRKGKRGAPPIVLVGKGLCFDSGGISIKPAQGMELMKFDMCGAAGVLGAMDAIGAMELAVNVVGVIGATTNMPSGTAIKPGDVVRSQLGKYIEIINTDAEGRLVLADLLSYVRRFDPAVVIDAATLTGAVVVALGHAATGVFGPDETLVAEVIAAGKRAGEPGWPLPVWDEYKELIKSDVADIKNSGGRAAGSVTAALFLKEFTETYPWVHLDIAGTAYSETDLVTLPKGPTGVPVTTFVEFVRGRTR